MADAIGESEVHGVNSDGYSTIASDICQEIGATVSADLPLNQNPYSELVGWIGGTERDHAFEIFTPNYDLLFEQAFERSRIPYFDGFCGSCEPFFEPATIANSDLPSRWARLWKLHGSLGWAENSLGEIVSGKGKTATKFIYPTHLKYDQIQKMPYSALIERLRQFLRKPDSLLLTCGFSFSDAHLCAVLDEALAANRSAAIMAFQYEEISTEVAACSIASRRANMSVYARDGAVINCIEAPWRPGDLPHPAWAPIRTSYWGEHAGSTESCFLLGDFTAFVRYVALTLAEQEQITEEAQTES